jgi:prophage DNA circulation protein
MSDDPGSYAAWMALAAAVSADTIQRAQSLPQLASYSAGMSLPALALAQRFYGAAAQTSDADALAALNGARHPLFLPPAGVWLEPPPAGTPAS